MQPLDFYILGLSWCYVIHLRDLWGAVYSRDNPHCPSAAVYCPGRHWPVLPTSAYSHALRGHTSLGSPNPYLLGC